MDATLLLGMAAPLRIVSTAGWNIAIAVVVMLATVAVFCLVVRGDVLKDKRRAAQLRRHRRR